MKKHISFAMLALLCSVLFISCDQEEETLVSQEVSVEVLKKLEAAGFNVTDKAPIKYDEGYIIEGDIFMSHEDIMNPKNENLKPINEKQYSTDNLVATNGDRVIKVYVTPRLNDLTEEAADLAIARYNAENLEISFERVSNQSDADIRIVRLNFFLDLFGVLGSAGFPTANGDPFNRINISNRLPRRGFDVGGIASIIAHEMGHAIGFRHTDFFDRGISCGGGNGTNEGDGGVGANQIPGTPAGASVEDGSWMLACSDGSDRTFNADDITALNFLY